MSSKKNSQLQANSETVHWKKTVISCNYFFFFFLFYYQIMIGIIWNENYDKKVNKLFIQVQLYFPVLKMRTFFLHLVILHRKTSVICVTLATLICMNPLFRLRYFPHRFYLIWTVICMNQLQNYELHTVESTVSISYIYLSLFP